MTGRERVLRAVKFRCPDRVPVYCFNRDFDVSDVVCYNVPPAKSFCPSCPGATEWGYVWEKLDGTMGQPKGIVLHDYGELETYLPPDAWAEGRTEGLDEFTKRYADRYILAGPDITGFTIATFLRGFENTLADLYTDRENIERVLDTVFCYEEELIKNLCRFDIQAIAFHDDWGMQNAMFVSPALWREVFKPRYARQFHLAHSAGKQVYFHSCGYLFDILNDLVEIGVDVFNFNQPEVMGVERLAGELGGRVCFNCPVDLQRIAITADRRAIYDYTARLIDRFGRFNGGFIGYVEEYSSIGLSEQNYRYCLKAIQDLGVYQNKTMRENDKD